MSSAKNLVMSRCGWLMVLAPKSWTSTWGLWWMPAFRQMVPESSLRLRCTVSVPTSPYQSLPVHTSPYQSLPVPTSTWWIPGHTWQWYAMMLLVQRVIKNEKSSKVSNATLRQTNIAIGHPLPMEAQWKNHLCHGAYALVSMVIVIVY